MNMIKSSLTLLLSAFDPELDAKTRREIHRRLPQGRRKNLGRSFAFRGPSLARDRDRERE